MTAEFIMIVTSVLQYIPIGHDQPYTLWKYMYFLSIMR